MRDQERERMMEKMIEKEGERERELMRGKKAKHRRSNRKEHLIKRMPFIQLNPLGLTIYRLLNSSRISLNSRCRVFLTFASYGVKEAVELLKSLEDFKDCIESKRMKALVAEISQAAREFEDVLESHVSDTFLPQSEAHESGDERLPLLYSLNLQGIEQDIDRFVEKISKMEMVLNPLVEEEGGGSEEELDTCESSHKSEVSVNRTVFISVFAIKAASVFSGEKEEYIKELENLLPEDQDDDEDYAGLFKSAFSRSSSWDHFGKIKDELIIWWINKAASIFLEEEEEEEYDAVSSRTGYALDMTNMVGSTDLFCKIRNYLIGVKGGYVGTIVGMAGIGKTALAQKILHDPLISNTYECCIFVRLGPEYQPEEIMQAILAQMPDGDKMEMAGDLDEYLLEGTLMVKKCLVVLDDVWEKDIWQKLLSKIFRLNPENSVLITTRKNSVAYPDGRKYHVPFLDKEESWDLLRGKIFGEKGCPREFEKAGKTIAENCEGLPLLIVIVADLLSKAEKTLGYWNKIAANKTNSIFVNAYEQTREVTYPSYYYLPQHLKACFLYLGVFPQNDEVRVSKLIPLWSADGFLGVSYALLQKYVYGLISKIISDNVALETQWTYEYVNPKACSLHSVFWYLCKKEAWNEKFLLVLNSYTDAGAEGIESLRRLSIYKNAILSIKDVHDSFASMSAVRSLLCTGPYHQYQVPMFFGLRLLKVLHALTIRFYEFPLDVLKLIQLRYISLTCNGNLSPSISKLWSLQCLILNQHQSIISPVSQSYLPVEIWDLQELEHLEITGRNLPDPPPDGVLENLSVLLDVGAHTCTEHVLGSIPNLEKLRVRIELMPGSAEPHSFCGDISHLEELTSLQYVIVNPELMFATVAPAPSFSFPTYLIKLTLSGLGYPWEEMNISAELPLLEVLKLKCYAFQGEKWEVKAGEFESLRYLLIEDTDLVQWTGVLILEYLHIKHCYKLQEIPNLSSESEMKSLYTPLREIWLEDCNPTAVTCAEQMALNSCPVYVRSSWLEDGKLS